MGFYHEGIGLLSHAAAFNYKCHTLFLGHFHLLSAQRYYDFSNQSDDGSRDSRTGKDRNNPALESRYKQIENTKQGANTYAGQTALPSSARFHKAPSTIAMDTPGMMEPITLLM